MAQRRNAYRISSLCPSDHGPNPVQTICVSTHILPHKIKSNYRLTLSLSRAILLTMKTETFSRYLVTLWLRRNLRPVRINWEAVGKPQPSYNEMMRNAARTNKASN